MTTPELQEQQLCTHRQMFKFDRPNPTLAPAHKLPTLHKPTPMALPHDIPDTNTMTIKFRMISGSEHELTLAPWTRLRDLQAPNCRAFRKPFPQTKACVVVDSTTYDEFIDQPCIDCIGGEVLTVVFIDTDDPYVYDIGDRRLGPQPPPHDMSHALALSPCLLPSHHNYQHT